MVMFRSASYSWHMRSAQGMTLIEILLVLAVMGILMVSGIVGFGRMSRNQSYRGYVQGFSQAVANATTRANETNSIYALVFDQTGFRYGPVSGGISACSGAGSAPSLTRVGQDQSIPRGVTTASDGWFCFSAPGLVHRLGDLPTCTYASYDFPCVTFSGPGATQRMYVSVGGEVEVR